MLHPDNPLGVSSPTQPCDNDWWNVSCDNDWWNVSYDNDWWNVSCEVLMRK